ncbi:hypothetical protein [Curtobacterium sp. PsM8]|uniref:hypothetical protein n=1 Tax=Curtobacterium sp. PsM8 TaxID=3030532 RepID=UPI00263AD799|nr:hypothetical protein [Curtobacterium sp. PsM8]MDN4647248.1 hypothetical protein [Curtobacterium sp. PsM8]
MITNEDQNDIEEQEPALDPVLLHYRESKLTAAIRSGDVEAVDRVLAENFVAFDGDERLGRREFLRRVLYSEILEPEGEPVWGVRDEETPANGVAHDWTDADGVRHVRVSFWTDNEEGLQLQKHISLMRHFNGAAIRR